MICDLSFHQKLLCKSIQLQNYENMSYYYHLHTKLPNELQFSCTHQYLLNMPHP